MFLSEDQSEALAHLWNLGSCFRSELVDKAWTCGEHGKIKISGHYVKCSELTEMAVMICQTCPVQYDCARYAVDYEEPAGTWAMHRRHLEWLQNVGVRLVERLKPGEAHDIIAAAEAEQVPVEQYVAAVRVARRAVVSSPA